VRRVTTFDGGVSNDDSLVAYAPQLHFYTVAWQGLGLDIRPGDRVRPALPGPGEVVVSCDERYFKVVADVGAPVATVKGCAASTGTTE
jgi:hypothetical protein